MTLARVEQHELGPRLFVGPLRVHHWHWGAALVLAGTQAGTFGLVLIAGGAGLIWVDRADLPYRRKPPGRWDGSVIGTTTSHGVW